MSRIVAALSICALWVFPLSNLINLSFILNRSRDIAARTRSKPPSFSLFCQCMLAAIRMPINESSAASVNGWNIFAGGLPETRLGKALLHTLIYPFTLFLVM